MSRRLYSRVGIWAAALALGCAVFPPTATACRILQFSQDARANADAAVVVELVEVTPQGDNSFRAKAVARRPVFGTQTREFFELGGYSLGASCGPLPEIGDLWVVYVRGEGRTVSITAFYPLGNAEALDPRVAASEPGSSTD